MVALPAIGRGVSSCRVPVSYPQKQPPETKPPEEPDPEEVIGPDKT